MDDGSGTTGAVQWGLADHEGSVRDILDDTGGLAEHRDYTAYGEMSRFNADGTPDTTALDFIFGFTGREWDDDIDLANHRARWYDPHAARFINQDPSGFAGGDANLYRYAGNNPVMYVDPSGLCPQGLGGYWDNPVDDVRAQLGFGSTRQETDSDPFESIRAEVTPNFQTPPHTTDFGSILAFAAPLTADWFAEPPSADLGLVDVGFGPNLAHRWPEFAIPPSASQLAYEAGIRREARSTPTPQAPSVIAALVDTPYGKVPMRADGPYDTYKLERAGLLKPAPAPTHEPVQTWGEAFGDSLLRGGVTMLSVLSATVKNRPAERFFTVAERTLKSWLILLRGTRSSESSSTPNIASSL